MELGLSRIQKEYSNIDFYMQKIYGVIKDEYEYVKKRRTFNTGMVVLEKMEKVSFEDLSVAMYAKVNEEFLPFIRKYEFILEEAKLFEWRFLANLDKRLADIGEFIKKNNYYVQWVDFLNFWTVKSIHGARESFVKSNVYDAYMDLLYQTYQYLLPVGCKEKLLGGLTLEGAPIWVDDKFPYCDLGTHKLENEIAKAMQKSKKDAKEATVLIEDDFIRKAYSKYGYNVSNFRDMQKLTTTSPNYTNALMGVCFLANEDCGEILNFTPMSIDRPVDFPRKWRNSDFYMEQLKRRKYVIPSKGIYAVYENASEITKGYFREIVKHDCVYLLFKLSTKFCGEIIGWYNSKTDDFFCNYSLSNHEEDCQAVENFVLENYYLLTVDEIDYSKRKLSAMYISEGEVPKDLFAKQPIVTFYLVSGVSYERAGNGTKKEKQETEKTFRIYNRKDYKPEKTSVNGYVRKLPVGQHASFEAKQYAVSLGYDLADDETYVRPFVKNVLRVIG